MYCSIVGNIYCINNSNQLYKRRCMKTLRKIQKTEFNADTIHCEIVRTEVNADTILFEIGSIEVKFSIFGKSY